MTRYQDIQRRDAMKTAILLFITCLLLLALKIDIINYIEVFALTSIVLVPISAAYLLKILLTDYRLLSRKNKQNASLAKPL